jgi:hypothetical protein
LWHKLPGMLLWMATTTSPLAPLRLS